MQEVTNGAPPADGVGERLTSGRREGVRLPLLPLGVGQRYVGIETDLFRVPHLGTVLPPTVGGSLPPGVGGSAEVPTLARALGRTPCLPPTSTKRVGRDTATTINSAGGLLYWFQRSAAKTSGVGHG